MTDRRLLLRGASVLWERGARQRARRIRRGDTATGGLLHRFRDARAAGALDYEQSFFKLLKDYTLTGYFMSEIGATQALAYEAVPGGYRGDLPLAPYVFRYSDLDFAANAREGIGIDSSAARSD
jgi:hypothetical protein